MLELEIKLKDFLEQQGKIIIFIHDKNEAREINRYKNILNNSDSIIIPTSVEALFALDEFNLRYRVPEDYYSPKEYYNYLRDLELKTISVVNQIDKTLSHFFPKIKRFDLQPALYHLFSFAKCHESLAGVYFKIKKIIEQERPKRIILFKKQNIGKSGYKMDKRLEGLLAWEPNENIFLKILAEYKIDLPVYFFVLSKISSNPISSSVKNNYKQRIKQWVQGKPRVKHFYYFFKTFKINKRFLSPFSPYNFRKMSPLLLLNNSYDWGASYDELFKKGYYIWTQLNDNLNDWDKDNAKFARASKDAFEELKFSFNFRQSFKQQGIDFFPILQDKIDLFLTSVVPASLRAFQQAIKLIKDKQLKGLLFATSFNAISKSIIHAAQMAGIPVVGWQHGGEIPKKIYSVDLANLLGSDLFLSWGRVSKDNRAKSIVKLNPKPKQIVVGSARLDKLARRAFNNRFEILEKAGVKNNIQPIILYATTTYYLSNLFSVFYPPASDNKLYDTQRKIINKLTELGGTKIIKLHPYLFYASSSLDRYCKSFQSKNVLTIRDKVSVVELFSVADIIIIDFPNTILTQALVFKKPIFCLLRHIEFDESLEKLLEKRAICSYNPIELMDKVKDFINSKEYKADINNNEFLDNVAMLDYQAAKRAASAVDELVKK